MALESARAELVGLRVRKLFLTKSKWLPYDGTVTAVNEDGEGLHITIKFDDGEVWVADTETEGEAQSPLEVVRGFARAFADGEDEVKPSKPASKRKAGSLAPEQPAKQARRARAAESEEDDAGGAEAESEDEDAPRKKAKAKPKPAAAGKKGGKSAWRAALASAARAQRPLSAQAPALAPRAPPPRTRAAPTQTPPARQWRWTPRRWCEGPPLSPPTLAHSHATAGCRRTDGGGRALRARAREGCDAACAPPARPPRLAPSHPSRRPQELNRLVAEVMRLMLFRRHKDGAPVAKTELSALVNKEWKEKRQLGPAVLKLAQVRFLSMFGMEMKELEKAKGESKGAAGGAGGAADAKKLLKEADKADKGGGKSVFVLRSALPSALRSRCVELAGEEAGQGFCAAVLSLVGLAGEAGLGEAQLWAQLAPLGVSVDGPHPQALGDPAQHLAALVRMRYLLRSKGEHAGEWVLTLGEQSQEAEAKRGLGEWTTTLVKGGAVARGGAGAAEDEGA